MVELLLHPKTKVDQNLISMRILTRSWVKALMALRSMMFTRTKKNVLGRVQWYRTLLWCQGTALILIRKTQSIRRPKCNSSCRKRSISKMMVLRVKLDQVSSIAISSRRTPWLPMLANRLQKNTVNWISKRWSESNNTSRETEWKAWSREAASIRKSKRRWTRSRGWKWLMKVKTQREMDRRRVTRKNDRW